MNKGKLTSIAAITGGVIYVLIYLFKLFLLIDLETFESLEKSLIIGLPIIIGLLAKDWNRSHTEDVRITEIPPEDKDEKPGGN
jgi:hypothetical protein